MSRYWLLPLLVLVLSACDSYQDPLATTAPARARDASDYASYGGEGGRQFAAGELITTANVAGLKPLWSYHTGDVSAGSAEIPSTTSFQNTPILVEGVMYMCSPFNRVVALDPATGGQLWSYNPEINLKGHYSNQLVCRGVSYWQDKEQPETSTCATRIFTATNDTRLIALDAKTGKPCADFGSKGMVDTSKDLGKAGYIGEHHHTSPPAIIGNTVVVGGSISDGSGMDAPSGVVRAFDARSGAQLWGQDLAPPDFDYDANLVSEAGYALATPNVWAPMSTDEELGLIYAPTGNPLPDYFRENSRSDQTNMSYYGSSLVALRADTGEVAWHYQFVHRDYWDFDTPAQPTLFELERRGKKIPAVAQATKMGFIFILDRRTGESLFPVEERPVPQNPYFPDLVLSPTQPFPVLPKSVADNTLNPEDAHGFTFWDRAYCRKELESLRYEGMYTPVSPQWTLMYTGNAGGVNWGGLAIDQDNQTLVVNSSNLAFKVKLIPSKDVDAVRAANPGEEISRQAGMPWGMWRAMVVSPFGAPCNPTPWGVLTAIDLNTGEQKWQSTLGTTRDLTPLPLAFNTGTPSFGGPLMTAGGITFIGATLDNYLRAFDTKTGAELWKGRLPAPATATPMSYVITDENGKQQQIVVVAAGGHGRGATTLSDTLVAFALDTVE
jgi:quinoprotein glucose dehydrogenase